MNGFNIFWQEKFEMRFMNGNIGITLKNLTKVQKVKNIMNNLRNWADKQNSLNK